MYQPQHEITISPYPFDHPEHPFVYGLTCSCGWLKMPHALRNTKAAIDEHYMAVGMAIPEDTR